MDNPAFRAELEDQRRAAAALAHNEFQELALSSIHILAELLKDPSPYIRLNAVRTTINAAMKPKRARTSAVASVSSTTPSNS